jgi:XisI protein
MHSPSLASRRNKNSVFFIHEDGTEEGTTKDLLAVGIPKESIILAFQHPSRRKFGEFALGL